MCEKFFVDFLMFFVLVCSCKGRYRGSEVSRGDIDDALGK